MIQMYWMKSKSKETTKSFRYGKEGRKALQVSGQEYHPVESKMLIQMASSQFSWRTECSKRTQALKPLNLLLLSKQPK